VSYERREQPLSIIKDLPFHSKTSTNDAHGTYIPSKAKSCKKEWEKSPLSTGMPFLGETAVMRDYKPYKIGPTPWAKKVEKWEPTEAYPD